MDTARYLVAVLVVVTVPPAIGFWLVVHPWIGFWRRVGPVATYVVVGSTMVGVGIVLARWRDLLLSVEFGTNPALLLLATVSYVMAVWIEVRCRRKLTLSALVGLPELTASSGKGSLLTEEIYGRIRHPRYVSVTFGLVAAALFVNYLAVYLLVPLTVMGLRLVVTLEERELRARFGRAYLEYSERVPRFVPRRRSE